MPPPRTRARTRAGASALRDRDRSLLLALTSLPTASGCEWAVQGALDAWIAARGTRLSSRRDDAGNLLIRRATGAAPRLLITAHLDHPAFVVRRVLPKRGIELEFRGGVHDPYFRGAAIEVFDGRGTPHRARIASLDAKAKPFKIVRAVLRGDAPAIPLGAIGRWALPEAEIRAGMLHTHACDDLAAVAAALIAYERLLERGAADGVGLLFTVAEEVGFLGAIRAASSGLIPRGAALLCLENSRSFPHDSPIGAGAILRVGDRLSVFSPGLTNALTQLYQRHAAAAPAFRWQRKLMAGGACEATAFAALGHESTCLCLPLGNYHNMVDIDGVLAGRRRARIGREFISIDDFEGLVSMLVLAADAFGAPSVRKGARGAARQASARAPLGDFAPLMRTLWRERSAKVLGRRGRAG